MLLIEAAMGFYDGLAGTASASGWEIAVKTDTPVILLLNPKGSALTLAAQVKGLQCFRTPSMIAGLILNRCRSSLAAYLTPVLRRETGLPVLGVIPPMEQAELPSRHLGLVTAQEIPDFSDRMEHLAAQVEASVSLDQLLSLARDTGGASVSPSHPAPFRCRIAVARDEAFCFYYQDNLDALRENGAEIVFFSPLRDASLPQGIHGLYLGGGYPERFARLLGENASMRRSVRQAVSAGVPTVAECGGFLYLQQSLEDTQGERFPMAGVLPGAGYAAGGLQRFGYLYLKAEGDSLLFRQGERIPAHEFHHWDSTDNGNDLACEKPGKDRTWRCGFAAPSLYAAFPHLHFNGGPPLSQRFTDAAEQFRRKTDGAG